MAFDGSGNYVLSDTIAPATNADANELQAILTDIQNALNKCVVTDGQSTITGALKGADGTAALPAYAFAADLNTGIYRKGSDNVGVSCGGAEVLDVTTAGASVTGVFSATSFPTGQAFISTDAGAGGGPQADLFRDSPSPAAADLIGLLDFSGRSSTAVKRTYARIISQIATATNAAEDGTLYFQAMIAGTLTNILQNSGNSLLSALKFTLSNVTNALSLSGGTTGQRNGSPTAGDTRYNTSLNGLEYWNGTAWIVLGQAPTVQTKLSGSGATYTPTTGTVRIRVRMCGGGGGGGARATNNGAVGVDTSFGSWTAIHGNGGAFGQNSSTPGAGGTGGATGTGTLITRVDGAAGQGGTSSTVSTGAPGGAGGSSPFGGAGAGRDNTLGGNAATNSGSGGAGGGGTGGANSGSGGGAGEYVEFWVNGPSATTYTVGTGGAGGAAGTIAGGNGAAGQIIIEEFYA